jgi:A/G-specific adenine glycosylase
MSAGKLQPFILAHSVSPKKGASLRAKLLGWYERAARDLPWRRTRDPYAVWLSETMLQQTRVDTVIPYYEAFLAAYPTVRELAEAPEPRVLALWSGLGYYRRARMLHAAAKRVATQHGGRLPSEVAELRRLEGVGAYTAGAIASIAFGRPAALVDGNVARVLARLFAVEDDVKSAAGAAHLWRLAEALLPDEDGDPGDWNQSLMELGATVCVPREPRCSACPVRGLCAGRAKGIAASLPRTAPKRRPTEVRRSAIVLASADSVLLARRRVGALFGGLWEPPTGDGDGTALARRLGVRRGSLEAAGTVVHVLSHRRLVIDVARGPLGGGARRRRPWPIPGPEYDAVEVVALAEVGRLPHATLARKILAAAARIAV